MPNFEFKKDRVCETAPNIALDSIVNVGWTDGSPGRKDFVLWYLRQFGVKRLRRDNKFAPQAIFLEDCELNNRRLFFLGSQNFEKITAVFSKNNCSI